MFWGLPIHTSLIQSFFYLLSFLFELFIIHYVSRVRLREIQKHRLWCTCLNKRSGSLSLTSGGPLDISHFFKWIIKSLVTVILLLAFFNFSHPCRGWLYRAFFNTSWNYVGRLSLSLLVILRYVVYVKHKKSRLIAFVLSYSWPSSMSHSWLEIFGQVSLRVPFFNFFIYVSCLSWLLLL
jgi:hypothetical protein